MSTHKTFILANKKTYRRGLRLFIKGKDGKMSLRICTFTTEHLVDEKQRAKNARKIHAEFITSNQVVIDALFKDSGYGKSFYLKGDSEGKLKRQTTVVTAGDAKRLALRNLMEQVGLPFDDNKPTEILAEEYNIHVQASSGRKIEKSTASVIPGNPVDVAKDIADQKDVARNLYEEKYGEPIPAEFKNDVALLDGLSNPNFDAQAYIAEKAEKHDEEQDTKEELWAQYFDKFDTKVPNPKKNDIAWIKAKLAE